MRRAVASLLLAAGLPSCAATGASLFPDDRAHEEAARAAVQQRAGFDLGCETFELVRLGDVGRLGGQMTSHAIGV